MTIEIPIALRLPEYRFILLAAKEKVAFEKDWQNTNNYKFDDPKLLAHLNAGGNYGVLANYGNLRIRDIDDPEFADFLIAKNKFDTFVVKTGKGIHLYFESPYTNEKSSLILNNGELRAKNAYVVGANCIHPNGRVYEVINNVEIKKLTEEELMKKYVNDYIKDTMIAIGENEADLTPELIFAVANDEVVQKYLNGDLQGRASRSEAELSLVCRLIQLNLSKAQIYKLMSKCKLNKWQEATIGYRSMTYEKAVAIITKEKIPSVNNDEFRNEHGLQIKPITNYKIAEGDYKATDALATQSLEIVPDKQVETMKIREVEWLVQDLIPKYSLTLVGGKSASYKSSGTLHMAYCMSEGKKVFGIYNTIKAKVLYLNEENAWNIFKPLVTKIRNGSGIENGGSDNMFFSTFQDLRLDTQLGINKLKEAIEKNGIEVIVLDSLKRFIGFEENNADKVNEFYINIIKPLMIKYKLTVIMLHHTKKDVVGMHKLDSLRGSSDFVNICDAILFYKRKIGTQRFEIEQVKNRAKMEAAKIEVLINSTDDRYDFVSHVSTSKDTNSEVQDCEKNIIDFLRKTPSMKIFTPADIIPKIDNYSTSRIKKALDELIEQKILLKPRYGHYEINKLHTVWLEEPVKPITNIL